MSEARNKKIGNHPLKKKSNRYFLDPSHSLKDDYVLLRLWTPTKNGKESTYTKTLLGSMKGKESNVGHLAMTVRYGDKTVYVSHWPKEAATSPAPVPSTNPQLVEDLEVEGMPKSYILLYGLDTKAIIARFEKDVCSASWALFGNKKNNGPEKAYNCSSTVYELLNEGGLFEYILDDKSKLKEPITPVDVAKLAHKAENVLQKKYLGLPSLKDIIEAEITRSAKENTSSFANFIDGTQDFISYYQNNFKEHWPRLLTKLYGIIGDTTFREFIANSDELLNSVKLLKKMGNKSKEDEKEKLNNVILSNISKLLSNKHIELKVEVDTGLNALHYAILKRNLPCIKALIEKFPEQINSEIKQPSFLQNISNVKPQGIHTSGLFGGGRSLTGLTPYDLALKTKDQNIIDFVKKAGGHAKAKENIPTIQSVPQLT